MSWCKHTEESVNNGKFFSLFNNLCRKGKIWINFENITFMKQKKPTVNKN